MKLTHDADLAAAHHDRRGPTWVIELRRCAQVTHCPGHEVLRQAIHHRLQTQKPASPCFRVRFDSRQHGQADLLVGEPVGALAAVNTRELEHIDTLRGPVLVVARH